MFTRHFHQIIGILLKRTKFDKKFKKTHCNIGRFLTMHKPSDPSFFLSQRKRRLQDLDKENNPLIKVNSRICFRCHKFNIAKSVREVGHK